MLGKLILAGVILAIVGIMYVATLGTVHTKTLTIESYFIDPGNKGSHYLVRGINKEKIELERPWWRFDNIDDLYLDVQKQVGKTVTFECYGLVVDWLYWYSNCYKELDTSKALPI